MSPIRLVAGSLAVLALWSCAREKRQFLPEPSARAAARGTPVVQNLAGTGDSAGDAPAMAPATRPGSIPVERAYDMNQGKTLFAQYNCAGCHSTGGGGGFGPPLMDRDWIYGSAPDSIYASIVHGRPNGMPAFGGRIPEYQVDELVAYVRSMSGHADLTASPGRTDHMESGPPENSRRRQRPFVASTGRPEGGS
jgi:cytochrome c oxidase cbb3-type subunit 3